MHQVVVIAFTVWIGNGVELGVVRTNAVTSWCSLNVATIAQQATDGNVAGRYFQAGLDDVIPGVKIRRRLACKHFHHNRRIAIARRVYSDDAGHHFHPAVQVIVGDVADRL